LALLAGSLASVETFPTMYPKTLAPHSITAMTRVFSRSLRGSTSPYPTVVMVVKAQYRLAMYRERSSSSSRPSASHHVRAELGAGETHAKAHPKRWAHRKSMEKSLTPLTATCFIL